MGTLSTSKKQDYGYSGLLEWKISELKRYLTRLLKGEIHFTKRRSRRIEDDWMSKLEFLCFTRRKKKAHRNCPEDINLEEFFDSLNDLTDDGDESVEEMRIAERNLPDTAAEDETVVNAVDTEDEVMKGGEAMVKSEARRSGKARKLFQKVFTKDSNGVCWKAPQFFDLREKDSNGVCWKAPQFFDLREDEQFEQDQSVGETQLQSIMFNGQRFFGNLEPISPIGETSNLRISTVVKSQHLAAQTAVLPEPIATAERILATPESATTAEQTIVSPESDVATGQSAKEAKKPLTPEENMQKRLAEIQLGEAEIKLFCTLNALSEAVENAQDEAVRKDTLAKYQSFCSALEDLLYSRKQHSIANLNERVYFKFVKCLHQIMPAEESKDDFIMLLLDDKTDLWMRAQVLMHVLRGKATMKDAVFFANN